MLAKYLAKYVFDKLPWSAISTASAVAAACNRNARSLPLELQTFCSRSLTLGSRDVATAAEQLLSSLLSYRTF